MYVVMPQEILVYLKPCWKIRKLKESANMGFVIFKKMCMTGFKHISLWALTKFRFSSTQDYEFGSSGVNGGVSVV